MAGVVAVSYTVQRWPTAGSYTWLVFAAVVAAAVGAVVGWLLARIHR